MSITDSLQKIKSSLPEQVTLVAVSKTKPLEAIQEAYEAGQRIFGENKIQELAEKYEALPKDIEWHMIGHVQRNKVKYMAKFVNLIHGVDNLKLFEEINKQAQKHHRVINCLLQIKIAEEDSKFGLPIDEVASFIQSPSFTNLQHIKLVGVMGMATFTDNLQQIKKEFLSLKHCFDTIQQLLPDNKEFKTISMGMSGDYPLAIECGSTMVRVGSSIFGARNYNN